jgi:hypothetical protein
MFIACGHKWDLIVRNCEQMRSDRLELRSDRLELRSPIFPNVTQNLTLQQQFDRNLLGLDLNSSSKPTFCEANILRSKEQADLLPQLI